MARNARDHGGGLDAAVEKFGGKKSDWFDLSTGINPRPFPLHEDIPAWSWSALPDQKADDALCAAARKFWNVPKDAAILAVPGCSSAIAQIPFLVPCGEAVIQQHTYNEHAASFVHADWTISNTSNNAANAAVIVHPNNPTGHFWTDPPDYDLVVIDESFCDIAPDQSLIAQTTKPGRLVLKSFGKFWGLAGLRLGFVIGDPALIAELKSRLGPWPVSGPALYIGTLALSDTQWCAAARIWLKTQIEKLDQTMADFGATPLGNVSLFRTYEHSDPADLQNKLAEHRIWTRTFPYSDTWIRLGVPTDPALARLKASL